PPGSPPSAAAGGAPGGLVRGASPAAVGAVGDPPAGPAAQVAAETVTGQALPGRTVRVASILGAGHEVVVAFTVAGPNKTLYLTGPASRLSVVQSPNSGPGS